MADKTIRIGRHEIRVAQNALDRAISYVSPAWAHRRFVDRARTEIAALSGGYRGGSKGRRQTAAWGPQGGSANAEIMPDLATLRDRSRDLVRNSPIAAGAIGSVVTNAVGTGLMPRPSPIRELLGWSEEQTAAWKRRVSAEFKVWADSKNCDATRAQNFYGLQALALLSTLENGDTFPVLKDLPRGGPYALAILLIEADRVCNRDNRPDTETQSGGIVTDENGAPRMYQILKRHPGALLTAGAREWIDVAPYGASGRRNILHLFDKKRIGQTRGVPMLAPVIEKLKQLSDLSEAELFAAVINSMFAVVTKTEDRGGLSPMESATQNRVPESGTSDAAQGSSWDGGLQSGLVVDLGLNESVESFVSTRPSDTFEPFFRAIVAEIGVAIELPFEVLMKHFTASYSAARAALLEAWKLYRNKRTFTAVHFCQPIYEEWMAEGVARGRIDAPGFFDDAVLRYAYACCEWHGDGPGSIDPWKEVNAAEKRLTLNLRTLAQEIAEDSGADAEETMETRGREVKTLQAAGLNAAGAAIVAAPAAGGKPGDTGQDTQAGAAGSDAESA